MLALDSEALGRLRRTMGSEAEYRDMLAEFLLASARLMADLQKGAAAGHWHDVERAAHTLKSMARMVGAFAFADACAAAETDAPRAQLSAGAAAALAEDLHQAQEAVRACLA